MVPPTFIFRLLHTSLNELGFNQVADHLIDEVHNKGLLVDNPLTLLESSRKVRLFDWINNGISQSNYTPILNYLDKTLLQIESNDVSDIDDRPNLIHILNNTFENQHDFLTVTMTTIYLIKRTIFLEKILDFLLGLPSDGVTNSSLIQYLSDELGPLLDSIDFNCKALETSFDKEIIQCLNRETESSKLLALVMQLPFNEIQVQNLIFNKDTVFQSVSIKTHSLAYFKQKLHKLLLKGYFSKLFCKDFYQYSLPYLNFHIPPNFLNSIVENYIFHNKLLNPYYLPPRITEVNDMDGDEDDLDILLSANSEAIDEYYKPKFPIKLLHTLAHHNGQVWASKFSPLGKYLATGASDGQLIIYDVLNQFLVLETLTSDNNLEKSAFVNSTYKSSTSSRAIIYLSWDKNDDYIVTGSLDTRVRVWKVKGIKTRRNTPRRVTRSIAENEEEDVKLLCCFILGDLIRTWSCEFLPINSPIPQFIIGSPDKVLKAYDIYGYELYDFYSNPDSNGNDNDIAMKDENEDHDYEDHEPDVDNSNSRHNSRSNSRSSHSRSTALLLALPRIGSSDSNLRKSLSKFDRINDLCITPDGKVLITANDNKQLVFYTIPDMQNVESVTKKLACLTLNGRLTSCSMSKNGKHLLLSLAPDELQIWDIEDILETGKPILYRKLIGHSQVSYMIRSCLGYWNIDQEKEELAISGSDDGDVYIWKIETGRLVTRVKGHREVCNSVSWNTGYLPTDDTNDYGKLWCSVGDDKLVKIWGPPDFYDKNKQ